jgi:hypothetical protein
MFDVNAPVQNIAYRRWRSGASERGSAMGHRRYRDAAATPTEIRVEVAAGTVVAVPGEPRPEGRIVELINLPTRFEADSVIDILRANGLRAMGKYGDSEGWMPHIALLDGYRVFVFDDDLDAARALLEREEIWGV